MVKYEQFSRGSPSLVKGVSAHLSHEAQDLIP